jgi:serine/threonine protein kinase
MSSPSSRISGALSGHYRLETEIGAGGMATVYLAQDLRHDRRVERAARIDPLRETVTNARQMARECYYPPA